MVEQIPGKVMHSDQTPALRRGKKQTVYLFVSSYRVFSLIQDGYFGWTTSIFSFATIGRLLAILQHTVSY